jgi:hypothetical protein
MCLPCECERQAESDYRARWPLVSSCRAPYKLARWTLALPGPRTPEATSIPRSDEILLKEDKSNLSCTFPPLLSLIECKPRHRYPGI